MYKTFFWHIVSVVLVCSVVAGPAQADQPCFTESELKQFLTDGPDILQNLMVNGSSEALSQICRSPETINQYPEIQKMVEARGWQKDRFAYILNHLVVGYKAGKIGLKKEQRVSRLHDLKAKINCSPKLGGAEKEQLTCQIDECITDINHTLEASKSIPASEKRLMYAYRKELNAAFKNKLPVRPIILPKL